MLCQLQNPKDLRFKVFSNPEVSQVFLYEPPFGVRSGKVAQIKNDGNKNKFMRGSEEHARAEIPRNRLGDMLRK